MNVSLPRVIGITGKRRSGKTTLAELLATAHGWKHDSFAGPLRAFVANILGISLAELEEVKEQPIDWLGGQTPRFLMQTVGTEWGRRMIHPDLWIKSALRRSAAHDSVVLSDVRFPNEAQLIHDAGGVILRVHRAGELGVGDHASETPLPDDLIDLEVGNDGTPTDMLAQVERFLFCADNPATDPDVLAYSAPGCPAAVMAGD